MTEYELKPVDGRKSFYGKAKVVVDDHGNKTLYSYGTPVLSLRKVGGTMCRLWRGWSYTTGRHVKAFAGLNKREYEALPYCPAESLA